MKLHDAVTAARIRKGTAAGIDDTGEFWLMPDPPMIGAGGSDGVGNNAGSRRSYLHLRHYRSGHVDAVVRITSWHQNYGDSIQDVSAQAILEATTTAEVIQALIAAEVETCWALYCEGFADDLTAWLGRLGIPAAAPGPDEVAL